LVNFQVYVVEGALRCHVTRRIMLYFPGIFTSAWCFARLWKFEGTQPRTSIASRTSFLTKMFRLCKWSWKRRLSRNFCDSRLCFTG